MKTTTKYLCRIFMLKSTNTVFRKVQRSQVHGAFPVAQATCEAEVGGWFGSMSYKPDCAT
jgi:hypothetical protein